MVSKFKPNKMVFEYPTACNNFAPTFPFSSASSGVLLSTPYQFDLAQLRMERLRLEEEHLLEVKRQEELERIRGPQPKWSVMGNIIIQLSIQNASGVQRLHKFTIYILSEMSYLQLSAVFTGMK